jgi:hypothetical protein
MRRHWTLVAIMQLFLFEETCALACSVMNPQFNCTFVPLDCTMATRSPCTSADGDFTYAEFAASSTYCNTIGGKLITPLDAPTINLIAAICSTTFFNTKWIASPDTNPNNKCILVDRDDESAVVDTSPGAFWSAATFEPSNRPNTGACDTSPEPCSALYCENSVATGSPTGCAFRAHDRSCGNYGSRNFNLWRGVRCLVCGIRAPSLTTSTTTPAMFQTTAPATSTTTKTTTTLLPATNPSTGIETPFSTSRNASSTSVSSPNQESTTIDDAFVSASDSPTTPLDDGAIIGIAIAAIVVLLALIVAVMLIRRRKRRSALAASSQPFQSASNSSSRADAVYGSSGFSQLT